MKGSKILRLVGKEVVQEANKIRLLNKKRSKKTSWDRRYTKGERKLRGEKSKCVR